MPIRRGWASEGRRADFTQAFRGTACRAPKAFVCARHSLLVHRGAAPLATIPLPCPSTCTCPVKIHLFGLVQFSFRFSLGDHPLYLFPTPPVPLLSLAALHSVLPKNMYVTSQIALRPSETHRKVTRSLPAPQQPPQADPDREFLLTIHESLLTNHALYNRYAARIENPATHSKQTAVVLSNRYKKLLPGEYLRSYLKRN